jgi:hypothetical protein
MGISFSGKTGGFDPHIYFVIGPCHSSYATAGYDYGTY